MNTYHNSRLYNQASLVIFEEETIRVQHLDGKEKWNIGRYSSNQSCPEIMLRSRFVARKQGWIQRIDGLWFYIDDPLSTNTALHNGVKIQQSASNPKLVLLNDGDVIHIGNEEHPVSLLFLHSVSPGEWETLSNIDVTECVVGKGFDCDIVIEHPQIANRHFSICFEGNTTTVKNISSSLKPLLNGKELLDNTITELHIGDCITLLDEKIHYLGGRITWAKRNREKEAGALRMIHPTERPALFNVNIQSKKAKAASKLSFIKKDKEILKDIRFEINEGTLVGVVGAPGVGKTTLAYCIGGQDVSGITGYINCRGIDMIANRNLSSAFVGYVAEYFGSPDATVRKTLQKSAIMRHSYDATPKQIQQAVSETLRLLDLENSADKHPNQLHYYERALLQLGCELVCGRNIIFLDNFGQGLHTEKLTQKLQELSHNHGITIIHLLHDLSQIASYDQVLILAKVNGVGRQFFSGSVHDAMVFFGVQKFTEICTLIEDNPDRFISI